MYIYMYMFIYIRICIYAYVYTVCTVYMYMQCVAMDSVVYKRLAESACKRVPYWSLRIMSHFPGSWKVWCVGEWIGLSMSREVDGANSFRIIRSLGQWQRLISSVPRIWRPKFYRSAKYALTKSYCTFTARLLLRIEHRFDDRREIGQIEQRAGWTDRCYAVIEQGDNFRRQMEFVLIFPYRTQCPDGEADDLGVKSMRR